MIQQKTSIEAVARISHPIKSRSAALPLERNERTVDFPDAVLEDLRQLVTGFVLRAYPETDDFYDALSAWSGFPVTSLLATDGADGALHRVFATYVAPDDEVVTQSPSYAMYPVYCRVYQARSRVLTFDSMLDLRFEDVLAAATPGTRLIALVNPNQPIESCFDLDQIRTLATRCRENGTVLLVDEAYYHFCEITVAPLTREFDNVIVARTMSKAFGLAGLRIGYLIAAAPVINLLRVLKPIYEVNHLNAAIGAYFLRRPELMEGYVADVRRGREVLESFFAEAGFPVHGRHSNTILVHLPAHISARETVERLAAERWLIRAETQAPTLNHLRITIGPADQMRRFCDALTGVLGGDLAARPQVAL